MPSLLGQSVMVYDKEDTDRIGYKGKVVVMIDEPKIRNMPQHGFAVCKYVKFDDPDAILRVMGRYSRGWSVYYTDRTTGTMFKGVIRSIDSFIKVAKDDELNSPLNETEFNCNTKDIDYILITDAAFRFEVCA